MRFECRVSGTLVDAMVGTAVRALLRRPVFIVRNVAAALVCAVGAALVVPRHGLGALGGVVVAAVLILILVASLRRRLTASVDASGYRPGALVSAEWTDTDVVVRTPTSSNRYSYDELEQVRRGELAISVVRATTRQVLVMPAEIAPVECTRRVGVAR